MSPTKYRITYANGDVCECKPENLHQYIFNGVSTPEQIVPVVEVDNLPVDIEQFKAQVKLDKRRSDLDEAIRSTETKLRIYQESLDRCRTKLSALYMKLNNLGAKQ